MTALHLQPVRSKAPIVRREAIRVGKPLFMHASGWTLAPLFYRDIVWLRTSESRILYWHGGKLFQEGTAFTSDRFLGCMDDAVNYARRVCENFAVTEQSSLSLTVQTTLRDVPHLINTAQVDEDDCQYLALDEHWGRYDESKPRNDGGLLQVDAFQVMEVWSSLSRLDMAKAAALRAMSLDEMTTRFSAFPSHSMRAAA